MVARSTKIWHSVDFLMNQILIVTVVSKYLNFTFSYELMLWFCPALWGRYIEIYLVLSVFISRSVSHEYEIANKIIAFLFIFRFQTGDKNIKEKTVLKRTVPHWKVWDETSEVSSYISTIGHSGGYDRWREIGFLIPKYSSILIAFNRVLGLNLIMII
jgi:hypothetical protein